MILLLLVLLGHKVVSSWGAAPVVADSQKPPIPPPLKLPEAAGAAFIVKNLKLIQELLMTHDKVL